MARHYFTLMKSSRSRLPCTVKYVQYVCPLKKDEPRATRQQPLYATCTLSKWKNLTSQSVQNKPSLEESTSRSWGRDHRPRPPTSLRNMSHDRTGCRNCLIVSHMNAVAPKNGSSMQRMLSCPEKKPKKKHLFRACPASPARKALQFLSCCHFIHCCSRWLVIQRRGQLLAPTALWQLCAVA